MYASLSSCKSEIKKCSNMKKRNPLARTLGSAFAYCQHSIDVATGWAFTKLEKMTQDQEVETESKNIFIKACKKIGNFFGETGSAYYKEYEDLKKRRK